MIAERIIARIKADPDADTPLDFLWRVACDENVDLSLRVQCARDVAPYLFPRLAAVAVHNTDDNRLEIVIRDFARPALAASSPVLTLPESTEDETPDFVGETEDDGISDT